MNVYRGEHRSCILFLIGFIFLPSMNLFDSYLYLIHTYLSVDFRSERNKNEGKELMFRWLN